MSTLAFADEYGNNSFDFDSQGSHFVVTAILVKEEYKNQIENDIEIVRQKYFQKGEIKSQKVGNNVVRRKIVLRELAKIDFKVFSIVIDKRKLKGEGFTFKKSFYKFVCGLVYKELFKTFPQLTITVDEHGGNDFMLSFKKYVESNHIRELFSGSEFLFDSSESNKLIQVADFIGGTIGRCYDSAKSDNNLQEYLEILNENLSSIRYFPHEYTQISYSENDLEKGYDIEIAELANKFAVDFIETKKVDSQEDKDQVNLVRLLLMYQKALDPRRYTTTKELIRHLQGASEKEISEQYFRSRIIGKLRDNGVLIASKSHGVRKGYKLPTSITDLNNFVSHGNGQIMPMIARIKKCRDSILLATHGKVDVLGSQAFRELGSIVDFLDREQHLAKAND